MVRRNLIDDGEVWETTEASQEVLFEANDMFSRRENFQSMSVEKVVNAHGEGMEFNNEAEFENEIECEKLKNDSDVLPLAFSTKIDFDLNLFPEGESKPMSKKEAKQVHMQAEELIRQHVPKLDTSVLKKKDLSATLDSILTLKKPKATSVNKFVPTPSNCLPIDYIDLEIIRPELNAYKPPLLGRKKASIDVLKEKLAVMIKDQVRLRKEQAKLMEKAADEAEIAEDQQVDEARSEEEENGPLDDKTFEVEELENDKLLMFLSGAFDKEATDAKEEEEKSEDNEEKSDSEGEQDTEELIEDARVDPQPQISNEEYSRLFEQNYVVPTNDQSVFVDNEALEDEDDGYFIKKDQEYVDEQAILKEMVESRFVDLGEDEGDVEKVRQIYQKRLREEDEEQVKKLYDQITSKQRVQVDSLQYKSMMKKYFQKNSDDLEVNYQSDDEIEEIKGIHDFADKEEIQIQAELISSRLEINESYLQIINDASTLRGLPSRKPQTVNPSKIDIKKKLSKLGSNIQIAQEKTKTFSTNNVKLKQPITERPMKKEEQENGLLAILSNNKR